MSYVEVGRRSDMWDLLYEAKNWREFFRLSIWWLWNGKYRAHAIYSIIHAGKTRLKARNRNGATRSVATIRSVGAAAAGRPGKSGPSWDADSN